MSSERLVVNRLLIAGPARNYEVRFRPGVNVIAGPISTGKSSILHLLDYALGAKRPPAYPELSKCSDVFVEFLAGGEAITIRRALKGTTAKAVVYVGTLDDVLAGAVGGTEMMARHMRDAPSVSSEVMRRLGLDNLAVKAAPTQESSDANAYSVRDLLLLLFVDQDRMGSAKRGFFEDHPFKAIKWRAGVEILHGLFDDAAAALAESLKQAIAEQENLKHYLRNAEEFLTRFRIPPADQLDRMIGELDAEKTVLREKLKELRRATETTLGDSMELVRRREKIDVERTSLKHRASELRRTLAQLGRLRVQYDRERAQLEFLQESQALVGNLPIVRCPACLQSVEPQPNASGCYVCHRALPPREVEVSVEARLRATRRRISDLESYMADVRNTVDRIEDRFSTLRGDVDELDAAIRRARDAAVLPDTLAVLDLTEAIALVEKKAQQAQEHLELRQRARGEGSNLLALMDRVERLRREVADAEASKVSPDDFAGILSIHFAAILREIRFPDVRDVRIDPKSFLPFVRNQVYGELSSRGAVSLVIVAWHLAVMRYALKEGSRFPRLLMLDSPLSNVGHDASDEAFRDQQIVDSFYKLLLELHRSRSEEFQMLIVDNRPPASAAELVNVVFTGDPEKGRFGLIDDEHPPPEVV